MQNEITGDPIIDENELGGIINNDNLNTLPEDDDYVSHDLTDQKYDDIKTADQYVDVKAGNVINKDDLSPWEIIKMVAKDNNYIVQEPKKSCNHCHGRGYEGIVHDTKMPVPCRCIFPPSSDSQKFQEALYETDKMKGQVNHARKRKMVKYFKTEEKRIKKIQRVVSKRVPSETNLEDTTLISKVFETYNNLKSLKDTAEKLNITLTAVKKILKNKKEEKIESEVK